MTALRLFLATALAALVIAAPSACLAMEANDGAPELNGKIYVNGGLIEAPPPYVAEGEACAVMAPLRAVAEKLGLEVVWRKGDQSVTVDGRIRIKAGETDFLWTDVKSGSLSAAPQIKNGSVYVPLDFFRLLTDAYETAVMDGSLHISADEGAFVWLEQDNVSSSSFTDAETSDYVRTENQYISIGNTEDGAEAYSFLRLPLGGQFMADEVISAKLFLKSASITAPSAITLGMVSQNWDQQEKPQGLARDMVDASSLKRRELVYEGDGWYSLDATPVVKAWLRGDMRNYGFALIGIEGEELFTAGVNGASAPYLLVRGAVSERDLSHGAFGFTQQPSAGMLVNLDGAGNCLSYALRDYVPVYLEDLGLDYEAITERFFDEGEDAVAELVAVQLEKYVAEYGQALSVSGFRRLEGFDSEIDPEKEYRIAFRVGCHAVAPNPLSRHNFDYHFWAQLNDGRWTEKFPSDYSTVVPGTAADISPERYKWGSARQWVMADRREYDRSKVIFYAVTKDTREFTVHRDVVNQDAPGEAAGEQYGASELIFDSGTSFLVMIRYPASGGFADERIRNWALGAQKTAQDSVAGLTDDGRLGEVNVNYESYVTDGRYAGVYLKGSLINPKLAHSAPIAQTFNLDLEGGAFLENSQILDYGKIDFILGLLAEKIEAALPPETKGLAYTPDMEWLAHLCVEPDGIAVILVAGEILPSYLGNVKIKLPYGELGDALLLSVTVN